MGAIGVSFAALRIYCKRKTSITPFRLNRPYPDPPTLDQWKAPPIPGTERILREAFRRKRQNLPEAGHLKKKKLRQVPWVLEAEFESDEALWLFLDELDLIELRRQRVKFELPNFQEADQLKKALFLLVKHQEVYQVEADRIMEKRIIRANEKAERRARNRSRRRRSKEVREIDEFDPFDNDSSQSWITQREVTSHGETPF
eukprot:g4222.t1